MQIKKNIMGFTLIEVLVSTALIGFAAILSLSIISVINKNQIITRDNVKYVWVTKSIKSRDCHIGKQGEPGNSLFCFSSD